MVRNVNFACIRKLTWLVVVVSSMALHCTASSVMLVALSPLGTISLFTATSSLGSAGGTTIWHFDSFSIDAFLSGFGLAVGLLAGLAFGLSGFFFLSATVTLGLASSGLALLTTVGLLLVVVGVAEDVLALLFLR